MILLILVLLFTNTVVGLEQIHQVSRRDYRENEQSPFFRQRLGNGFNNIFKVSRQDFSDGSEVPFSQSKNDNWPELEPSALSKSVQSVSSLLPKLFVPATTQHSGWFKKPNYNRVIPVSEYEESRKSFGDDGVLPAIPKWRNDEVPLAAVSQPLSTSAPQNTESRYSTVKYFSLNDDVEISEDQKELLESSFPMTKKENFFNLLPPIRRRRREIIYRGFAFASN